MFYLAPNYTFHKFYSAVKGLTLNCYSFGTVERPAAAEE